MTATRTALAVVLVSLVLGVFAQVRQHEFVDFDDFVFLLRNPHVRAGLTPASVLEAFTTPFDSQWTPLSRITLQLDQELHGLQPRWVLLGNVGFHAAATLLLFAWLCHSTGATWRSAFVAAVFAIHPLHVESVAWATERKDVVSALFFAVALLSYDHYVTRSSGLRYAFLLLCVAAGLLAKPMLVTLPCVLLLLDHWPYARLSRRAVLEKLPLLALAAVVAFLTWSFQSVDGATDWGERISISARLANAVDAYVFYLHKTFWPSGLAAFYPHPLDSLAPLRVAAGALLLLALSVAALLRGRREPAVLVGWLWFLGMLVPVIGLVQVGEQGRADRYVYLPMLGLCIAVAWEAARHGRTRARQRVLGAAATVAVLVLSGVAWVQVGTWRNSRVLFENALSISPDSSFIHLRLATLHLRAGSLAEAEKHYRRSFELAPEVGRPRMVLFHLGMADRHKRAGDVDAALARYRQAVETDPEHARANRLLGLALVERGELAEARRPLERALPGYPDDAELRVALVSVALAEARFADAAQLGREALRIDPRLREVRNNLAWLLATCPDPAVRDAAAAVELAGGLDAADPQHVDTMAAAHAAAGRLDEAVAMAERAIAMAEARGQLAAARDFRRHLESYRRGEPWIDPPPSAP